LKDPSWNVRDAAVEALGKFDKGVVEPLMRCLEDDDSRVRFGAAKVLGKLGDARATVPLRAALPDWQANVAIGDALTKLQWHPTSEADEVYLWICERRGYVLRVRWDQTKNVLLADIQSGARRKIENAAYALICLGDEEVVPDLKRILETSGNAEMAEIYLHCGNNELYSTAGAWAAQHRIKIRQRFGADGPRWCAW
jgi:HEAT repeat protein